MKFSKPFLLFASLFLLGACEAQAPVLSDLTCQEFWGRFEEAKESDKGKARITREMKELWDHELSEFRKENPGVSAPRLYALGESAYFIMVVYTACEMTEENLPNAVHDSLQAKLQELALQEQEEAE